MPGQEETQATELNLLQDYVKVIMDILEAILKESPSTYEYFIELSHRITIQLQEQNSDYIFYVGKRKLAHPCLPMGISVSPVNIAQIFEQHQTQEKRCKWCDDILDSSET